MTQVNPPPHQRIPPQFLKDPATRGFFERLNFNMFQLWKRTGGSIDLVAETESATNASVAMSAVNQLRAEINGFPELTVDTTGFTSDTTFITADKVIA